MPREPEPFFISLGLRIAQLRRERGLSQESLAERLNMSANYLGKVERAAKRPSINTLEQVAVALDVSLATLFADDGDAEAGVLPGLMDAVQQLDEADQRLLMQFAQRLRADRRVPKRAPKARRRRTR